MKNVLIARLEAMGINVVSVDAPIHWDGQHNILMESRMGILAGEDGLDVFIEAVEECVDLTKPFYVLDAVKSHSVLLGDTLVFRGFFFQKEEHIKNFFK